MADSKWESHVCKSGEVLFYVNKITGESRWPCDSNALRDEDRTKIKAEHDQEDVDVVSSSPVVPLDTLPGNGCCAGHNSCDAAIVKSEAEPFGAPSSTEEEVNRALDGGQDAIRATEGRNIRGAEISNIIIDEDTIRATEGSTDSEGTRAYFRRTPKPRATLPAELYSSTSEDEVEDEKEEEESEDDNGSNFSDELSSVESELSSDEEESETRKRFSRSVPGVSDNVQEVVLSQQLSRYLKNPNNFNEKQAQQQEEISLPPKASIENAVSGERTPHTLRIATTSQREEYGLSTHYKCGTCDAAFADSRQLDCHLKIHDLVIMLMCPVCKKCFVKPADFALHVKEHTRQRQELQLCTFSQNALCTVERPKCLGNSAQESQGYRSQEPRGDSSQESRGNSSQESRWNRFLKSMPPTVEGRSDEEPQKRTVFYNCGLCSDASFSSLESLNFHMKIHPSAEEILKPQEKKSKMKEISNDGTPTKDLNERNVEYNCGFCNFSFTSLALLNFHLKIHPTFFHETVYQEGAKLYACRVCKRHFQGMEEFDNHVGLHNSENYLAAPSTLLPSTVCEIPTVSGIPAYETIDERVTVNSSSESCSSSRIVTNLGNVLVSEDLSKYFSAQESSQNTHHISMAQEELEKVASSRCSEIPSALVDRGARFLEQEETLIPCKKCTRHFTSERAFHVHSDFHERNKWKCANCSKEFESTKDFYKNKCRECRQTSENHKHTQLRAKSSSNGNSSFPRPEDNSTAQDELHGDASSMLSEISFMLTDGDGEEPQLLPCPKCTRKFTSGRAFQVHLNFHERNTRKCVNCSKEFESRSDLYRNRCRECSNTFGNRIPVQLHATRSAFNDREERPNTLLLPFDNSLSTQQNRNQGKDANTSLCDESSSMGTPGFPQPVDRGYETRFPDAVTKPIDDSPESAGNSFLEGQYERSESKSTLEQMIWVNKENTKVAPQKETQLQHRKLYTCSKCESMFDSVDELKAHMRNYVHSFKCDKCDVVCKTIANLRTHERTHEFIEPACADTAGNQQAKKTRWSAEESKQAGTWSIPDSKATIIATKKRHMCSKCDRKFATIDRLQFHLRNYNHTFKCHICSVVFTTAAALRRHRRALHKTADQGSQPSTYDAVAAAIKTEIEQSFGTDSSSSTISPPSETTKALTASENNGGGAKPVAPRRKNWKCSKCAAVFFLKRSLSKHLNIHNGLKLYQCDQCDKGYNDAKSLLQHKRIHSGERPYACDVCGKSFRTCKQKKIHYVIHSKKKLFKCTQCERAFTQYSSLARHRLTHSGRKPYECKQCGKAFSQPCSLSRHEEVVHNGKRYYCHKCDMSYTQSFFLKKHIKSNHKDEGNDLDSNHFQDEETRDKISTNADTQVCQNV